VLRKDTSNVPVIDAQSAATLMDSLTELVAKAGAAVLSVNRDRMMIGGKIDGSPVTDADLASDRVIAEGLAQLRPDIPVLSEERVHLATPPYSGSLFVIDPLDGTKEFIAGRDEYTVNLAIVTDGVPLLGIIGAPALGAIWRGLVGRGAQRVAVTPDGGTSGAAKPIATRPLPPPGSQWIAAVSRSHADRRSDAFIERRPGAVRKPLGSAVKFCRIAEGGADIYPRLAPTGEWDVAAGHALVTAAGGKVTDELGAPLRFGLAREGFLVPEFIAWGDPSAAPRG
jgi:3'(2'), 5'-bisphosphate nucleotidase